MCAIEGNLDEIPDDIYVKHYRTLCTIKKDHMVVPEDLPCDSQVGYWYYGKSRTGKTYAAVHEFPGAYRKTANNKWWDGYRDQENVIMDDLDKKHEYMGYHLKVINLATYEQAGDVEGVACEGTFLACASPAHSQKDRSQEPRTTSPAVARLYQPEAGARSQISFRRLPATP